MCSKCVLYLTSLRVVGNRGGRTTHGSDNLFTITEPHLAKEGCHLCTFCSDVMSVLPPLGEGFLFCGAEI